MAFALSIELLWRNGSVATCKAVRTCTIEMAIGQTIDPITLNSGIADSLPDNVCRTLFPSWLPITGPK